MTTDTSTQKPCSLNSFKRSNYFHGMLLTDLDFKEEQKYHLHKRRLLNRTLFGWGIVCGLDIECKPEQKTITINPGLALDCQGREIYVEQSFEVDLAALLSNLKTAGEAGDPCAQPAPGTAANEYSIVIRYHEAATNPIPVYVSNDSCEKKTCEYSRHTEGFCIELCQSCPPPPDTIEKWAERFIGTTDCVTGDTSTTDECATLTENDLKLCKGMSEIRKKLLNCPDCGSGKHCIVLGKVTFKSDMTIPEKISRREGRTYVLGPNLIKQYMAATMTGLNQYCEVKVGTAKHDLPLPKEAYSNPIAELCWLIVRRLVIDQGDIVVKTETTGLRGVAAGLAAAPSETEVQFKALQVQVDALKAELEKVNAAMADKKTPPKKESK